MPPWGHRFRHFHPMHPNRWFPFHQLLSRSQPQQVCCCDDADHDDGVSWALRPLLRRVHPPLPMHVPLPSALHDRQLGSDNNQGGFRKTPRIHDGFHHNPQRPPEVTVRPVLLLQDRCCQRFGVCFQIQSQIPQPCFRQPQPRAFPRRGWRR